MLVRLVVVIALSTVFTACATSQDPRQGGFLGGLQGIRTGAYDARVQQRQAELSRQQSIQQQLKEKAQTLESEVQARDQALASEQQSLSQMQKDLSRLESDLGLLNAESNQQRTEIAALNKRLEDHRQRLATQQMAVSELDRLGGSAADPSRYQLLLQERNRLAEESRRLQKYTEALSNALR